MRQVMWWVCVAIFRQVRSLIQPYTSIEESPSVTLQDSSETNVRRPKIINGYKSYILEVNHTEKKRMTNIDSSLSYAES
ncbi:hypothetical protein J6590_085033 [Homalodisca vitripennis]|nr:hypothetical protein J6590_085033 [Homalodisca vitripennis]